MKKGQEVKNVNPFQTVFAMFSQERWREGGETIGPLDGAAMINSIFQNSKIALLI